MASLVALNRSNIVNRTNNVLRYELNNSSVNFKGTEVALASVQLYNSQFNIDAATYRNNTFSIIMPASGTTLTIPFTLQDGYYSYSDLNNAIQLSLIQAGAYLIDAAGNNVFYIKISENSAYYACQVDVAGVPTTLPVGFTRPASGLYSSTGSGLPSSAFTPRLVIDNSNFGNIIGFSPSTMPANWTTTTQSFLSTRTPQINPTSSFVIRCNLVNNSYSNPPDILSVFTTQGTSVGQMIDVKPAELAWLEVVDASRSYIQIEITDQDGGTVFFRDSNISIQLLLRQKK
jgi:hypothetical protein